MTSNLGSRQVQEYGRGIGFDRSDAGTDIARQDIIRKALNKSFAPEFINRIDEIITFNQLDREAVGRIVDIEVAQLSERMEGMGYGLTVTDRSKAFLADKGYSREYGARMTRDSSHQGGSGDCRADRREGRLVVDQR